MKRFLLERGRWLKKEAMRAAGWLLKHMPGCPWELIPGSLTYNQDGLATVTNCDFINDPRFAEAYRLGEQTGSWKDARIHWRIHVLCWAADRASRLEGDFVECGVNRGGFSRAVMHFVDFPKLGKTFYLLDTFRGLEESLISDAERRRGIGAGKWFKYEECYEAVCKTFEGMPVVIVRGLVPETLPLVKASKVCYLSIDMNCVAPEIAAAEYFWDKLVPGAVIILDDYGWEVHNEQKVAFDRFAAQKRVMILRLPTGQGLIFKP